MNSIKNLERLRQIHSLIEQEISGTPWELAQRLKISERLVYHLIEQLKDYNAPIQYDRGRKTYYYSDDFRLEVNISVSVISNDEITQLLGGCYLRDAGRWQMVFN